MHIGALFNVVKHIGRISNDAIKTSVRLGSFSVILDPPTGDLHSQRHPHLLSFLYIVFTASLPSILIYIFM